MTHADRRRGGPRTSPATARPPASPAQSRPLRPAVVRHPCEAAGRAGTPASTTPPGPQPDAPPHPGRPPTGTAHRHRAPAPRTGTAH
ncbi:hypothetical protein ACFQMH_31790, partial [Streptomyces viridiviolaceus]